MEDEVRITLRLPSDLHAQLVKLTEENKTSLNGQIVTMLREWFNAEEILDTMMVKLINIENALQNRQEQFLTAEQLPRDLGE